MARRAYLLFGGLAYGVFLATFLYLIAFVGDLPLVAMTVDRGPAADIVPALAIDVALIALFGVQHSVMARQEFKRVWTRIVPPPIERSVYVLSASLVLIALFAFWRPIPGIVWHVEGIGAALLWGLFGIGWLVVLTSTFLISHFELFGLKQAYLHLRRRAAEPQRFRQPFFYKFVRHPLYSGFFIAFWATPSMSVGHLLLAVGMSAYMLAAIRLEERDMIANFGAEYEAYRRDVGMLAPRFGRSDDLSASRDEPMPQFVIEREMPGAGQLGPDALKVASQGSCRVLRQLGSDIQWVTSYVTDDKIYCVYRAPDADLIRRHAEVAGFPANRVSEVRATIDPTTAE